MKFTKTLVFISFLLLQGCNAHKQSTTKNNLDKVGEITATIPEAAKFLPGFPAFEDTEAFFNDSILYQRGKMLRDSERGKQAIADANIQFDYFLEIFGEAMEVNLSEENTPAIVQYMKAVSNYTGQGIMKAKGSFERQRPFRRFGEHSSIPEEEETLGKYSSYPSGHSTMAWTMALALTAIDDEHEYNIIHLGYELGQSRVIVGYHYQSDVDAGRMAASVTFAKIVSDKEFIKLMNLAKEELKELRNK